MKFVKTLLILLISTFISCKSVTFLEIPTDKNVLKTLDKGLAPATGRNEIFVVAVNQFCKDHIRVFEDGRIKFDTIISNLPEMPRDAALGIKVNKTKNIKIYINNTVAIISRKQMQRYKFIFLYKRNKKIIIELDNKKSLNELSRTANEYKYMR